jgi:FkbM family methyltransferase
MIESLQRTHRFFRNHALGGRDSTACWVRWLRWQLGSRLLPYPVEVPWLGDSRLVMERGMTGATGNYYCGLHEFADMALLLHYFSQGTGRFLDVGANIGSYTILASAVCNVPSISLEPVPSTFAKLQRNLRANGLSGRVDARCMAAGGGEATIRFTSDQDTTNRAVADGHTGPTIQVPVSSLDAILEASGTVPDFWKVDVEGYEAQVLAGAARTLSDPAVSVVLLEADDDGIAQTMKAAGFQRIVYDPFERTMSDASAIGTHHNHVWVRNPGETQSRCRAARSFQAYGISF